MRKFFYWVNFSYVMDNGETSEFDLGVFSTPNLAKKKILESSKQTGFSNYSLDNYEIIKIGVDFEHPLVDKSNVTLYLVAHEYIINENFDSIWTTFDFFSTKEKAQEKIEYLRLHSRLGKKYPDNFEIVEIHVDNFNDWSEGFVSYSYPLEK